MAALMGMADFVYFLLFYPFLLFIFLEVGGDRGSSHKGSDQCPLVKKAEGRRVEGKFLGQRLG